MCPIENGRKVKAPDNRQVLPASLAENCGGLARYSLKRSLSKDKIGWYSDYLAPCFGAGYICFKGVMRFAAGCARQKKHMWRGLSAVRKEW